MSASFAEPVRQLVKNKGISEELLIELIKEMLLIAYQTKFGTIKNAVAMVDDQTKQVLLYSKKEIVDEVQDEVAQISLDKARELNTECELSDEILIEIKPNDMGRLAIQAAKRFAVTRIKDIEKDIIYSHYKDKIGVLLTGQIRREKNEHLFVDIGMTEAILPFSQRSPKEVFNIGGHVKAIILEVRNDRRETQIVLSRSSSMYVQRLLELEIPEIQDGLIEVKAIIRELGYRTKVAVQSNEIEPIGPCIGVKGMRIQNVIKELGGEKVDIVRYDDDPRIIIKSALSPAKVESVYILDEERKEALAVVAPDQLSLSIGKAGQNIKLACKLTGYQIDIKTADELEELNLSFEDGEIQEQGESYQLDVLEGLDKSIITKLMESGVETLEHLVELEEEQLLSIDTLSSDEVHMILKLIDEQVVVMKEEDEEPNEGQNTEETVSKDDQEHASVVQKDDVVESSEHHDEKNGEAENN